MNESTTVVALLTPPGASAIAVLALRGPEAWSVMRALFRPGSGQLPAEPQSAGSVWFGHLGDAATMDEVVMTIKQVETPVWLEIHAHGGRQVVEWLIELLTRHGMQRVTAAEFERLVATCAQAEALIALSRAATVRTAAILLDQLEGALEREITTIRGLPGDDARHRIEALLQLAPVGLHLTEPWRVVIAGKPNVGKSSLANALAGFQRSIVAPVAGTTRDAVSTSLAIDGWPIELVDTAGIREGESELEAAGIDRARRELEEADLILWIVDATAPASPDKSPLPGLQVANKCDLPAARGHDADVTVSALTGEGISTLAAVISRKLVPNSPEAGSPVPFLRSQIAALDRWRLALQENNPESRDRAIEGLLEFVPKSRQSRTARRESNPTLPGDVGPGQLA